MTLTQKQERITSLLLAGKPSWVKPIDITLICVLVMRADSDGKCWASQETLCRLIGISKVKSLRASLNRLLRFGWILEISRKGSQQSNIIFPQLHNLPKDADPEPVISLAARQIVARYYERVKALPKVLSKNGRYRAASYPHKSWPQHWGLVVQGWLDGGATVDEVTAVVEYAFHFRVDVAKRGPQCLKQFGSLLEACRVPA